MFPALEECNFDNLGGNPQMAEKNPLNVRDRWRDPKNCQKKFLENVPMDTWNEVSTILRNVFQNNAKKFEYWSKSAQKLKEHSFFLKKIVNVF